MDLLFERLSDEDISQRKYALKEIKNEVSSATTSMTQVPKPLKFMSAHYKELQKVYMN